MGLLNMGKNADSQSKSQHKQAVPSVSSVPSVPQVTRERNFQSVNAQTTQATNLQTSTVVTKQVRPQSVTSVQQTKGSDSRDKTVQQIRGSERDKALQTQAPINVIAIEDEDPVAKEKAEKSDTDESSSEDSESETSGEEEGEVKRDTITETKKEEVSSSESTVSDLKKKKPNATEDGNESSTKKKKPSVEMREITVEECITEEIKGECNKVPFIIHRYKEISTGHVWWMASEITTLLGLKSLAASRSRSTAIKIKLSKGGGRIAVSTKDITAYIDKNGKGPLAIEVINAIGKTDGPVKSEELKESNTHLTQMDSEGLNSHNENADRPSYTQYKQKCEDEFMFQYVKAVFEHINKKRKLD